MRLKESATGEGETWASVLGRPAEVECRREGWGRPLGISDDELDEDEFFDDEDEEDLDDELDDEYEEFDDESFEDEEEYDDDLDIDVDDDDEDV